MMQRPNPRRGKRPGSRMSQPFELTRQQSAEEGLAETAEAVLPTEEAPTPAQSLASLPRLRRCRPAVPGARRSAGLGAARLARADSSAPRRRAESFAAQFDLYSRYRRSSRMSLRLGDHLAAVLSAQVQAGQSVTTMLNIHLPAEQDAAVTLWNDSEMPLVVQQGSLDLLTLEE